MTDTESDDEFQSADEAELDEGPSVGITTSLVQTKVNESKCNLAASAPADISPDIPKTRSKSLEQVDNDLTEDESVNAPQDLHHVQESVEGVRLSQLNSPVKDIKYPSLPPLGQVINEEAQKPPNKSIYGWRIPRGPKERQDEAKISSPNDSVSNPNQDQDPENLDDKTRKLFDGIAAGTSSNRDTSAGGLIDSIFGDLKKVSIKSNPESSGQKSQSSIPILSDLSTLTTTGWNWANAGKLINAATNVTSQVTSVLDTVAQQVNPAPVSQSEHSTGTAIRNPLDESKPSKAVDPQQSKPNIDLVDLTLKTMEVVGRSAFDAMTEKKDGKQGIKLIGRPWEQFIGGSSNQSESQSSDLVPQSKSHEYQHEKLD